MIPNEITRATCALKIEREKEDDDLLETIILQGQK